MKQDSVLRKIGGLIGTILVWFVLIAVMLVAAFIQCFRIFCCLRVVYFVVLIFIWIVVWPFIVYYRVGALYWVWIGLGWLVALVGVVMGLKNGFFTRCRERLSKKNRAAMSTPENES